MGRPGHRRLRRGRPRPRRPADAAAPARSARSLSELRRERAAAAEPPPDAELELQPPEAERGSEPLPEPDGSGPEGQTGEVDIDDVIVAWAEILPDLPPATRAAVREAQPLAVDGGVITFGVPKAHYEVALPRFKKEADNIRAALSQKLGRRMMFKPVAHDGFDAEPVGAPAPADGEQAAGDVSDEEEMLDIAEMVDAPAEAPAVDSVSLITQSFGATVVEEVPRD